MAAAIRTLEAKNVPCTPVHEERWGLLTRFRLPGGGEIGLYQPKHPTTFDRG